MKYLSIFASVLLATASAYGQSGEKLPDRHPDPTLQKPELYAGYDCVNLLRQHRCDRAAYRPPVLSRSAKSSKL